MTQTATAGRAKRKVKAGVVVSNRMTKTIVVRVRQLVTHTKYGRVMRQTSAFKVHDETNSARIGDWVKIMETRPLSKEKRWRLVEIVRRASSAPPVPDEKSAEPVSRKAKPQAQQQVEAPLATPSPAPHDQNPR